MTEKEFRDKYYSEAKEQTISSLPAFIDKIMDMKHDYGTICCAMAAAAISAASAVDHHEEGGITGFQAGVVMWEFVRKWLFPTNKSGLRIIDYDDMLYPQYSDKFMRTISQNCWDALQSQAKEKLQQNSQHASPDVIDHWNSILAGNVPFEFTINNED